MNLKIKIKTSRCSQLVEPLHQFIFSIHGGFLVSDECRLLDAGSHPVPASSQHIGTVPPHRAELPVDIYTHIHVYEGMYIRPCSPLLSLIGVFMICAGWLMFYLVNYVNQYFLYFYARFLVLLTLFLLRLIKVFKTETLYNKYSLAAKASPRLFVVGIVLHYAARRSPVVMSFVESASIVNSDNCIVCLDPV